MSLMQLQQDTYEPAPFDRAYFERLNWLSENHIDAIEKAHNDDQAAEEDSARFYVIVERDRSKPQSRGNLFLYDTDKDDPILIAPLVTGSAQSDPDKYGGCTPPILWVMTEKIKTRDHPHWKRGNQTMARIHPVYADEMLDYKKRTYQLIGKYAVPFMIHAGGYFNGSSTGCLAIVKMWKATIKALNSAWEANDGFLSISVEDV